MKQKLKIYTARKIKNDLIYDKILFNEKFVKLKEWLKREEEILKLLNDLYDGKKTINDLKKELEK